MATHPYPTHIHNSHHFPEENYRYMQWGAANAPDSSTVPHLYLSGQQYHTDYYPTERQNEDSAVEYSQVAALDTGFRKLKSNQIEILRELKREYEVLRNTELESGNYHNKKLQTDRSESNNESSKSRSDGRSSSYSQAQKTRRKSQYKEMQITALEKKQMQLMLNNSMKKIEQLLSSEIQLKKIILELRSRLENSASNEQEQQMMTRKHREDVQSMKRYLQDSKRQIESLKQKISEKTSAFGALEGQVAVSHIQIKKKDQRIRAFEEEIYLEKNKFCNLELDLKKCRLEAEMMERSLKEELSAFQRKLNSVEEHKDIQKNQEIQKLKRQLELKDQRYKLLLAHKEEEQKNTKQDRQSRQFKEEQEYIDSLKKEIEHLKSDRHQTSHQSDVVLTSILEKLTEIPVKQDEKLQAEVHSLRQELKSVQSESRNNKQIELHERIRQLETNIEELQKNMEDENIEKMYFIEDIKKIKNQMIEERRNKEEAQQDVRELKQTLRKVQQEARKYSYELQTLRNINIDLTENHQQNKSLMFKSQQVEIKDLQLAELKEDHSKIIQQHKNITNSYENEIKLLKRRLAEEQVRAFKIKEELELKLNLSRTEMQAQIGRLVAEIDRIKKIHAHEMNERISQKTHLEGKLMEKNRQLQRITNQLNAFVKKRDSVFQTFRAEQEKKVQAMQDESTAKVDSLASKIESLADLSNKYAELMHRNAMLEQDHIEMKRALRHNRQVNDGIDHLWSIKEAEYSNLNEILKSLE